jgi:hypothetical protein
MRDLKPYIKKYEKCFHEKYEKPFREELIPIGQNAQDKGYLNLCEFKKIYKWKASRVLNNLEKNEEKIISNTREALAETDITKKLKFLLDIRGVRVAVASAVLTVINPVKFGIIDKYAWKALGQEKLVKTKTFDSGKAHKRGIQNYVEYLEILRRLKENQHIQTTHDVDKALMMYGKDLG